MASPGKQDRANASGTGSRPSDVVGAMTSRSRLSVILVLIIVTLLSVVVYLQNPLKQVKITVDNFRPRQRHLTDIEGPTLPTKIPQNDTHNVDTTRVLFSILGQEAIPPTRDFMTVKNEELEERKRVLRNACKQYGSQRAGDIASRPPHNIFVDHEHKVAYCAVPKIACTSWKKVFLVLNKSFKTTEEISQYYANREGQRMLVRLHEMPPSEVNRVLTTYTTFMFARHPFSRILSAFRNKLAPDTTFPRAGAWQRGVGNRILGKYREDHRPDSDEYDLTFEEFIKYLIDPDVPRLENSNKHWSEIYNQCLPCDIDYDIIGKFETLGSDSKYILKLIHAEDIAFPGSNSSSPTGSSNQTKLEYYYKNVPLTDLQNLYEKFKIDFTLFGYEPPTLAFKGS